MLLTNIYAVNKYVIIAILIHGIIDQNGMPRVCMESLMPFFMWSYENLEAACLFLIKVCGYQMSPWDVFYLNSSKISPQTDACWMHYYNKCTYSNTQEPVVWLKWHVTTGQPFFHTKRWGAWLCQHFMITTLISVVWETSFTTIIIP